jgi:RNA polymerase sigma-70 factor (ECF subfamily)
MSARERFERLAGAHLGAAFNLAYWIMRDRAAAEDVVQDAYLRAFRAFASFRGEDIRPWLLAIVRNTAYRAIETRKRTSGNVVSFDEVARGREPGERLDLTAPGPSPETAAITSGEGRLVAECLAELPLGFRDILVLREIEGLSYREIAEVMAVPIGTVMSRLSRAREEMRMSVLRRRGKDESNAM